MFFLLPAKIRHLFFTYYIRTLSTTDFNDSLSLFKIYIVSSIINLPFILSQFCTSSLQNYYYFPSRAIIVLIIISYKNLA